VFCRIRTSRRGVDVKPPSAGGSPGRPGLSRALERAISRIPVPGSLPGALRPSQGPLGALPGLRGGVDVKATPAEGSRGAPRGPKRPQNHENRQKRRFWPPFPILGLFGQKWGILPDPDLPARGVLHQPLAPGPCPGFLGYFPGIPGGGGKTPFFGKMGWKPQIRGFGSPGPGGPSRPGRAQGPGARG